MAKNKGRGTTRNIFFKDQEMNVTVLRTFMGPYDDGATIGEHSTFHALRILVSGLTMTRPASSPSSMAYAWGAKLAERLKLGQF